MKITPPTNLTIEDSPWFHKVATELSELPFTDYAIDYIDGDLLKVTMLFGKSRILMVTKPLNDNSDTVIFTYFFNKKLLAANVMELSEFSNGFKNFISEINLNE